MTELEARVKRAKLDIERTRLDIGCAQTDRVCLNLETMKQLGLTIDDRDRMRAKDLLNTALHGEVKDTPEDKEICIRSVLQEAGINKYGMDSQLGKQAKDLYLQDYPDYAFNKKEIYVNGQRLEANIWYESQKPYVERAMKDLCAKKGTQVNAPRS